MKAGRFGDLVGLFIALCLIGGVGLFLGLSLSTMRFPYDLTYGEAQIADQARRLVTGGPVYRPDLNEPPYVIDVYPPVYPLAVALVGALTGLPFIHAGRLVSLLAALWCALAIGAIAWRATGQRRAGAVAVLLFLGNPWVLIWTPLARIDLLGLAFSLTGLWLTYTRWRSWRGLAVAAGCLVMAGYTRQSYLLAAPLTAVVWLWRQERPRCGGFIGLFLSGYFVPFTLLNWFTRGGFFGNTVTVSLVNPFEVSRAIQIVGTSIAHMSAAAALALLLLAALMRRDPGDGTFIAGEPDRDFILYLLGPYIIGALIASLTAGKVGSGMNYTLEIIAALALSAGMAITWLPRRRILRPSSVLILVIAQILVYAFTSWRLFPLSSASRWRDLSQYDSLYQRVTSAAPRGPVLADEFLGMVVLAGQPVYFQPFDYRQLYLAGRWDPAPLVADIESQAFPLIVIYAPGTWLAEERWAAPIREAISRCYQPTDRLGGNVLYEPLTDGCSKMAK